MRNKNQKELFRVVETFKEGNRNEFPETILFEGKNYSDALEGFQNAAEHQGKNDDLNRTKLNMSYTKMKLHNMIYRTRLKHSGRMIRNFTNDEILNAIKDMSNNKAPDIFGVGKENIVNLSDEGRTHILPMVNEMLQYPDLYSMIFANLSVANYLYKGKMKKRNLVTSYRKISIGSFLTKVCDKIMAPSTKQIAKEATQDTQFGFTPGINYLLCGVLRETLVRKRLNRGERTYVLAVDVKNAFSTTSREAQMFELKRLGEEEGIWRDDRLSLKAKGIWAYMKSKPGNWDFSAKRIATESRDETKSVQRGMKELEECGYLSKRKLGNGRVHYTLVTESYIGVEPRLDKSSLDDSNGYKYGR